MVLQFFEKDLRYIENLLQSQTIENGQLFNDCHIKTSQSLKAILKTTSTVSLEKPMLLLLALKWNL